MFNDTHCLSFGCSALAGLYNPISEGAADDVLNAAWDTGIRYFDTAPHYGNGMSEHRLGRFLREREGWLLSTKVGRVLSPDRDAPAVINGFHNPFPFRQNFDYSYDGIMRSVEGSFNRLGLNRIDILYVHDIGDPGAGTDGQEHYTTLLESGADALLELKSSGVVEAVGLGVNTVEACTNLIGHMPIDLILLAGRYTLLDQSAGLQLFPTLQAEDIKLVMGGVFNSGILATGPVAGAHYDYAPASQNILDRTVELQAICQRFDVPLAAAALQFPSRSKHVASTLIGTSKQSSLLRNVAQFNAPLPDGLWDALRDANVIVDSQ